MYEECEFQVRVSSTMFSVNFSNCNHSYRFVHISRTLRALQSSTKTSLRIDEDGLLSIQFLMPNPRLKHNHGGTRDAFIEFRVRSLLELRQGFLTSGTVFGLR